MKLTVIDKRPAPKRPTCPNWRSLAHGETFYANQGHGRALHMRMYEGIINLEDPQHTYGPRDFEIREFEPVRVEIHVV